MNRLPIWNSQTCSMFPLAFVTGSLQGHWWGFISRNYVVWTIFFLMNVFIALKGTHFWFLFELKKCILTIILSVICNLVTDWCNLILLILCIFTVTVCNCGSHGNCNQVTGLCECENGYYGDSCEIFDYCSYYEDVNNVTACSNGGMYIWLVNNILSRRMRLWYLSHRRPAKNQASGRIRAVSPEPLLFPHMSYGSRRRVRPNIRHLASLDGCACVFEEWIYGGQKVPKSHELAQ